MASETQKANSIDGWIFGVALIGVALILLGAASPLAHTSTALGQSSSCSDGYQCAQGSYCCGDQCYSGS